MFTLEIRDMIFIYLLSLEAKMPQNFVKRTVVDSEIYHLSLTFW